MDISTLDSAILDTLNMGVYYVDLNMKVLRWNKAIQEITGYEAVDLPDQSCKGTLLCHLEKMSEPLCNNGCPLKATNEDGIPRAALAFIQNKSGERIPIKAEIKPIYIDDCIVGSVAILGRSNIPNENDDFSLADSMAKMTMTDRLTGLYNRSFFESELNVKLSQMASNRTPYGVLFLDIDDFSTFNNNYGHEAGDKILAEMTKAVLHNVRKSDVFCRWGGEEFVGIFQIDTIDGLVNLGNKILKSIREARLEHNGEMLGITASIGITSAQISDTAESAISRADELMYESKTSGKNKYTIG